VSTEVFIKGVVIVRVGLFGGTFNPVHWGHLRSAEEIRELFNLEQVIFIPTNISPHKESQVLVSPHHRLTMLNLALEGNPFFVASDIELKRAGKSYSIETVNYFKQTAQEECTPFFIVGVDAFLEISTWKKYQELFSLCNFIVMTRPRYAIKEVHHLIPHQVQQEFSYCPDERRFIHRSQFSIYLAEITAIDISSLAIRTQVHNRRSVTYLLPHAVESYIEEHALYLQED
jgi:nicotinate-nucleotide adenylyltransferase